MTNIRLIHNPFTRETTIYCEKKKITAEENKIYSFLNTNDFNDCLLPFNKKYAIWQGLLPELMLEVNDDELHITFEGREVDFQSLENAFKQCGTIVTNLGYENNWRLFYIPNFNAEYLAAALNNLAGTLREICESRAELREVDSIVGDIGKNDFRKCYKRLQEILSKHLEKWENSDNKYKEEKVNYINSVVIANLEMLGKQFSELLS